MLYQGIASDGHQPSRTMLALCPCPYPLGMAMDVLRWHGRRDIDGHPVFLSNSVVVLSKQGFLRLLPILAQEFNCAQEQIDSSALSTFGLRGNVAPARRTEIALDSETATATENNMTRNSFYCIGWHVL